MGLTKTKDNVEVRKLKGDGKYSVRYRFQNKDTHKWEWSRWTKVEARNLTEARRLANSLKIEESAKRKRVSKLTVNDVIDELHKERERMVKRGKLKESTVDSEKYLYDKIKNDDFGSLEIATISTKDIQDLYSKLSEKITPLTLYKVHVRVKLIITEAIKKEYLQYNPISTLPPSDIPRQPKPSLQRKMQTVLKPEDVKRIVDYINVSRPNGLNTILMLLIHTGMRHGEILALEWKNYITKSKGKNEFIYVRANQNWKNNIVSPKTLTSERLIPVNTSLSKYLKEWHSRQEDIAKAEGIEPPTFLCTDDKGKHYTYNHPYTLFCELMARLRIGRFEGKHYHGPTMHSFRKYLATQLHEDLLPTKDIQAILGHSEASTTMDFYAQPVEKSQADGLEKFAKNFDNGFVQSPFEANPYEM